MFNFGPGELAVMVLLAIILLGPAELPTLAHRVPRRVSRPERVSSRWSWSEWALVSAALLTGVFAVSLYVSR